MITVSLYARVSKEEQAEPDSLDAQERAFRPKVLSAAPRAWFALR